MSNDDPARQEGDVPPQDLADDVLPEERAPFHELAARHGLAPTGGSDYHGENKPGLSVGTGRGDLRVPDEYLDGLEARRP